MRKLALLISLLVLLVALVSCNSDTDPEPVYEADVNETALDDLLGVTATDNSNLLVEVLPIETSDELDFSYSTPLETGNGGDLPLEVGTPLETGTVEQVVVLPVDSIPLEANTEDLAAHVVEELDMVGSDLPRTNDMFSMLRIAVGLLLALLLLKLSLNRRRVGT